jgi:FKBP-type peptidyl-prolyl cis-trans isomerase
MKATLRFAVFVVLGANLVLIGCNRKPKTHKDQVSYTIGVQFGKSLKSQDLDLDSAALARGIEDGLKTGKIKLSDEEMQTAMAKLSQDRQNQMKVEADKNKLKADEFLAKNKSEAGVQVTSSGLQYKIIDAGQGPQAKIEDVVVVNYRGKLVDGTEFDSSYKRNMPAEFPLKGVIPGWTEGLQLMKKGGKTVFYIPPELAYGDRPRNNIPSNSVLIFDVELLEVKAQGKGPTSPAKLKKK